MHSHEGGLGYLAVIQWLSGIDLMYPARSSSSYASRQTQHQPSHPQTPAYTPSTYHHGNGPPPGIDPQLWQWFSAVDSDRSGSISVTELQTALVNGTSDRLLVASNGEYMNMQETGRVIPFLMSKMSDKTCVEQDLTLIRWRCSWVFLYVTHLLLEPKLTSHRTRTKPGRSTSQARSPSPLRLFLTQMLRVYWSMEIYCGLARSLPIFRPRSLRLHRRQRTGRGTPEFWIPLVTRSPHFNRA